MKFQWNTPQWPPRSRTLRIGKLISAYVSPTWNGKKWEGMKAKINNKYLGGKTGTTFKNIPEAKRAVEIEVVKMITSAYKKVVKK